MRLKPPVCSLLSPWFSRSHERREVRRSPVAAYSVATAQDSVRRIGVSAADVPQRISRPAPLRPENPAARAEPNARSESEKVRHLPLVDTFAREHTYLRISLTERCNLRCTYCMPEEGVPLQPTDALLTVDEILRLVRVFASRGVTKLRFTGGEPTLHPELGRLVHESRAAGLAEVGITTNAIALRRKLPALLDGGLNNLNISLDTLREDRYTRITRRLGLQRVLETIDLALELGAPRLKLNCVVMRDFNLDEVTDFVAYTRQRAVDVRFIEYMPFDGNQWNDSRMVSMKEMLENIEERFGFLEKVQDGPNDTAKSYRVPGYAGQIGFISSMSDHFCGSCNRMRITADGNLKVCLFGAAEVSLRDAMRDPDTTDHDLERIIEQALSRKK
eukprot:CAMPEP_0174242374 /NCGR_PEP_ID=MMETSP0417-20130205/27659_1 /TAXON_ID=242541 /ORGANISM="Mayorella sp, Strain BSH-02190019" /LENGTH=388 /DNA_ID=CAMNT_0015321757 /DNA_START=384 /DNA_END=1547 /DNA_ORIENTATION=-